jgi:hypothetical protein
LLDLGIVEGIFPGIRLAQDGDIIEF